MGSLAENGGGGEGGEWQPATVAAQAGFCQEGNAHNLSGHGKALWTASAFERDSLRQPSPYSYRRVHSPNSDDLAHAVAALECAEAGLATSSGMGAVVAGVMGLLSAGDAAVVHTNLYGGCYYFFSVDAPRFGIEVRWLDAVDPGSVEAALSELAGKPEGPQKRNVLVFLETITNPIVRVADVPGVSAVAKKHGALLMVDNTFATPLRMRPILEGADVVIHSATKFLGGHSDLLAGVVVGSAEHVKRATSVATTWGLSVSPFDAWLAVRGIRTLQVRMERAWETSAELVKRLSSSDLVLSVHHAPKCAVFAMEVRDGWDGVSRTLDGLRLIKFLPTLGGVTTTVSHPASTSHSMVPPLERQKMGVTDGIIRVSVGLEAVDDLWSDLKRMLTAAKSIAKSIDATGDEFSKMWV